MEDIEAKKSLCILSDYMITEGVASVLVQALPVLCNHYEVTLYVLTGHTDEAVMKQIPSDVLIEKGNYRWTRINEIKAQLPLISAHTFRKLIKKHFDITIIVKPLCRSAGLAHIADINIYWNHSSHDILYADTDQLDIVHKLNRFRLRGVYRKFDQIWHVNDEIKKQYEKTFGLHNCYTLLNPIGVKRILQMGEETPADYEPSGNAFTIVMVGRLSHEKGYDRVLQALGKIHTNRPFEVIIVGEGQELTRLYDIAKAGNLLPFVRFPGRKENPYPYMKAADLLFCPSREESFGIVLLEAMLLRTPVVATRTLGTEYVTQNGTFGYLIENDDESIQSALENILQEPTRITYSLDEAFNWACDFDIDRFEERILRRLEAL